MEETKVNPLCADIKPHNISCDGKPLPVPGQRAPLPEDVTTYKELAENIAANSSMEQVPPALLHKMKEYAKGLRKRNPNMKPERARELTAKKFNIKLL